MAKKRSNSKLLFLYRIPTIVVLAKGVCLDFALIKKKQLDHVFFFHALTVAVRAEFFQNFKELKSHIVYSVET